ncbi:type I glyceraldehyde-3-phosphate dehydrogenase [candidate division WOR-3 bacterium]|uniref:Glyceraldehyde-3-phosphate dehydrogenase n=1 Tax=candidate division WOR-3 bacterium TaxID=2052148 RepID=A0A9D5QC64_UNCW3|nr:type I glyceraldehyde-3-phosphate dehydrogenase [candidate division WOR-3 bacterium]MBD3364199.1 type I glyceraldehyde-3-phosphate dehydrogenase [candidate division WOR-3 bacterium]
MAVRVAVNGFGRIGRIFFRSSCKNPDLDIVAVNDITDAATLAHLLTYDSVHRRDPVQAIAGDGDFTVGAHKVKVLAQKDPAKLPWKELGIDVVVEATGIFRTFEKASLHLKAGAKKVVLSAPGKGKVPIPTFVMGVNHTYYKPDTDHIINNASCTTNCLAPVVKVLDEGFTIQKGFMTTVHSYTADQRILDAPHSDLRRARAAAVSMIPTTTGATKAITKVMPHLEGRLAGMAIRVPTPNVSIVDFAAVTEKLTNADEINAAFKKAAEGELAGILTYLTDPLVSVDLTSNPASSIFDSGLTEVVDGNLVKVFSWYDNEWGYANRIRDLVLYIGGKL